MIEIYPGRSLLLYKPRPGQIEHCFVVITEPHGDPAEVIIVNFSTRQPTSDPTLILTPDDHPYLTKPESAVNYADAVITEAGNLQVLVALNKEYLLDDCPAKTLARIQEGVTRSKRTPNVIKERWREIH